MLHLHVYDHVTQLLYSLVHTTVHTIVYTAMLFITLLITLLTTANDSYVAHHSKSLLRYLPHTTCTLVIT
jgi:hypothetical protein